MNDRESISPLLYGLAVSLLLHGVVAATLAGAMGTVTGTDAIRSELQTDQALGDIDSAVTSLNWISHDDYKKHLALMDRMDQAAAQKTVEPDPNAKSAPADPTPPGGKQPARITGTLNPTAPQPETAAPAFIPPVPVTPTPSRKDAIAVPAPTPPSPTTPTQTAAKPAPETPTPPATADPAPEKSTLTVTPGDRPTVAPKTDREAFPVSRFEWLDVTPGEVIARQGLRIATTRPRFDPIALLTTLPKDPDVAITFDRSGRVRKAEILKSTGYANVDGPVLNSLYQWTAEGKALEAVTREVRIQIHIKFKRAE